jgi:hypothetical protein
MIYKKELPRPNEGFVVTDRGYGLARLHDVQEYKGTKVFSPVEALLKETDFKLDEPQKPRALNDDEVIMDKVYRRIARQEEDVCEIYDGN